MKLVFATRNRGKLRELHQLLAIDGLQILALDDLPGAPEVEEDGETFADNAAKKAREVARATGLPALADDSGLEVDALDGAPGVRSARYAGDDASDAERYRLLLRSLQGVPPGRRGARFRCVVAFADPATPEHVELREGACEGRIADAPRGDGGFGYDPVFLVPDLGRTFAEIPAEQKNQLSHRGQAMRRMAEFLRGRFGSGS
jgi:XTP/dITP diphosphohydrolase